MASRGIEMYLKYFKGKETETYVKSTKKHPTIHLTNLENQVIKQLANNESITVLRTENFSARYPVRCSDNQEGFVHERFVKKPLKNLSLNPINLVYHESYVTEDRVTYDNVRQFIDVIKSNMKKIAEDGKYPNIFEVLDVILTDIEQNPTKNTIFTWPETVELWQKDELGTTLAEIIPAIKYLIANTKNLVSFPLRHNNPLFDIYFDEKRISIKYGNKGSKSSLFGLLKDYDFDTETCPITKILQKYNSSMSQVASAFAVGSLLKLKKDNYDKAAVIDLLETLQKKEPLTEQQMTLCSLYKTDTNTIVGEMSRKVASHINDCKPCLGHLRKSFQQKVNREIYLDKDLWRNGIVKFTELQSSDAVISVIGSKSAKDDTHAKQGALSFFLRSNK